MAAQDAEDNQTVGASPIGAAGRRLSEARWFLAAVAAFIALVVYSTGLTAIEGGFLFAAIVALTAVLPRAPALLREAAGLPEPADQIWPETGVKLFTEALPDPCIVLDRRGIVRYANRRAVEAFAIRPGDPLTFRLRVPDLLAAFDRVAKGGPPEQVEFAERVPTERWFAAWFARIDEGARGSEWSV